MVGLPSVPTGDDQPRAIIIGCGMAGATCAWSLSTQYQVVVLEVQSVPAYHTTGRSAALYSEYFGDPVTKALTRASRDFLHAPPPEISESTLLRKRGTVALATAEDHAKGTVDAALAVGGNLPIQLIDLAEARRLCPVLRPRGYVNAVYRESTWDIDVAALHHGFVRAARSRGARLLTNVRLTQISAFEGGWRLRGESPSGLIELQAGVLINAAGAWADEVARLAKVPSLGLRHRRRTVACVDIPVDDYGPRTVDWPMMNDLSDSFYFKPESGGLIVSPCDSTDSAPCDAQPEELDVALALDRLERLTSLRFTSVRSRWAGLRTFAIDEKPVLGALPEFPNFYWVAGLGGSGIQTAPAVGRTVASLVASGEIPKDLGELGLTAELLSPSRLQREHSSN